MQTHWSRLRGEEALTTALRDTAFVTAADGAAKKPSELYDPEQPLFAAAFLGCAVFPTDQFAFPAWLALLREVRARAGGRARVGGSCVGVWMRGCPPATPAGLLIQPAHLPCKAVCTQ